MSKKRALIAGALALVYPGLGHVYLRRWFRAASWIGLAIATAVLVVPESAMETARSGGLDAVVRATRTLSGSAVGALLFVRAFNVLDATLIALRPGPDQVPSEPTCPNCGRELDDDLDFCQWCAASTGTPPE